MLWQYIAYVVSLAVTCAVSVFVGIEAWRRRRVPGALPLLCIMLLVLEWVTCYYGLIQANDITAMIRWSAATYLATGWIPVFWLMFALRYANRESEVRPWRFGALMLVPVTSIVLLLWDPTHGLVYRQVSVASVGPYQYLAKTYGPWFWIHTAYAYGLMLVGAVVLFGIISIRTRMFRGQAIALTLAMVVPLVGNVLYVSNMNPFRPLDPTPSFIAISGIALAWALFKYGLLDIVPVVREAMIEGMQDGVFALDSRGRVVFMNPVARAILKLREGERVGQAAAEVIPGWTGIDPHSRVADVRGSVHLEDGSDTTYDVLSTPLRDRRGRPTGRLVVWRDVTALRRAQDERDRVIDELQAALKQVRQLTGLLPICSSCKKIRDDAGYWSEVEDYIRKHSEAEFSHGICPDCARRLYGEYYGPEKKDEKTAD